MLRFFSKISLFAYLGCAFVTHAETVQMHFTSQKDTDKSAGTIEIAETQFGLLFTPQLHGLTSGMHGFHIHLKPNCQNHAMAAGGHWDPTDSDKHLGPYNKKGHLGDLPVLYADKKGNVTVPVLAPRIKKVSEIKNHALMIHYGGDNYSDTPKPLGGGEGRMICGVVK